VKRADGLLAVPNDPLRYAVCDALAEAGDTSAARALDAVLSKPEGTLNPNVLRMHAVQALARCGDARSLEALAPLADKSQYRNALTRSVVATLGAIGQREKKQKERVRALLVAAFPDPVADEREQRIALLLARDVQKALEELTGRSVDFPGDYDAQGVERLRREWSRGR